MKSALLTLTAAAAVAVGAPTALAASQQGYHYLGDTLSTEVQAPPQGVAIITDTLGGKGEPQTFAPTNAADAYSRYQPHDAAPATGYDATKQPYVNGGASPAVADAGSGFYRAHLSTTQTASTTGGSRFNWSDAGVGAGTGLVLVLALAGAALLAARRRRPLAL